MDGGINRSSYCFRTMERVWGDHGESSHGYFIYQSTLWVPLLMHWPVGTPARPSRIERSGGLIDLAPTILDILSVPAPSSFQGRSLLSDEGAGRLTYSESLYTYDAFHWSPLRSLRGGDFKYTEAPHPELYNLRDDPREQVNLIRKNSAKAQELRLQLSRLLTRFDSAKAAPARDSSPDSVEMLRSLGYLSGGSRPSLESGPDPKDRLAEYQLYENALAAMYADQLDHAILTFRKILTLDSRNTLARYYLGESYLKARKPDAALREWDAALSIDRNDEPAAEAIGEVWLERQDYEKAREYFERAVAMIANDYTSQFKLGVAEEHLGMRDSALQHIQAACKLVPDSAECRTELKKLK